MLPMSACVLSKCVDHRFYVYFVRMVYCAADMHAKLILFLIFFSLSRFFFFFHFVGRLSPPPPLLHIVYELLPLSSTLPFKRHTNVYYVRSLCTEISPSLPLCAPKMTFNSSENRRQWQQHNTLRIYSSTRRRRNKKNEFRKTYLDRISSVDVYVWSELMLALLLLFHQFIWLNFVCVRENHIQKTRTSHMHRHKPRFQHHNVRKLNMYVYIPVFRNRNYCQILRNNALTGQTISIKNFEAKQCWNYCVVVVGCVVIRCVAPNIHLYVGCWRSWHLNAVITLLKTKNLIETGG